MTSFQTFRSQHQGSDLLLLPNAWDAGSARLIESLGAKAIATTSAGVAWSRGYPDGDALPTELLLSVVREIAHVVRVPLSIDIEGGYSNDPAAVGTLVADVIDAGAVGINIEDGAGSPEVLCAKIEAAKQVASHKGVDLFINVRTDVYLRSLAHGDAAVKEVVRRAGLYQAAGCDGLFVPGLIDVGEIETIAGAIDLPLNIMLMPGLPSFEVLRKLGVRRLSAGSSIAQAVLANTGRLVTEFLASSPSGIFAASADYRATNQLFSDT